MCRLRKREQIEESICPAVPENHCLLNVASSFQSSFYFYPSFFWRY